MPLRGNSREGLIIAAVAALAVYGLALLSPAIFNDADTYWHVRAGQWMLAHHAVLSTDPFSLSFAGKPWETQEWLAEIGMAGAFQAFGWSGVAVLTGLSMALAAGLLALYLARWLEPVPCIVVLVLALGCVMPDYLARPHILALPFLVAWIIGLANAAAARRAPHWTLLPVMAVWANLHGSFIFGIALIFPFALEAARGDRAAFARIAKAWGLFAVGAVAAALLNPRGVSGLLFPLQLMHLKSLSAIGEWQSPDFHKLNPMEIAVLTAVFFLIWRGVRLPVVRLLVLLGLFHLALQHARYDMLLGIAGAILLAEPVGMSLRGGAPSRTPWRYQGVAIAGLAAAMLVCATIRIAWPVRRTDGPGSPISELAALPPSVAAQPVFNNYAFGGLLIFDGIKPLVDSRADLYGDAYLADYSRAIDADEPTVEALFRKYRIAWTMLAPGDPLVAAMDRRAGWHRLIADRYVIIHVGPGAVARSIPPARLSARAP